MMRRLLPAFLLPVVVTAVTLGLVAWNRSVSRGPIVMTERELQVSRASDDNSATSAWIAWQYRVHEREWIPRERLASLGFDLSVDPAGPDAARHYQRMLPRQAWAVFELGGPVYEGLPEDAKARGSRLVPIDIGSDPVALAARYPDAARYFVTAAVVRVAWMQPPADAPYVTASIDSISPRELHVPRALAPALRTARFRASVLSGRRFEPWIAR